MTTAIRVKLLAAGIMLAAASGLAAQGQAGPVTPNSPRQDGPVIAPWGGTFDVPAGSFMPPADAEIRVKFDIGSPNDDPAKLNMKIDTVARFLNMHARAGLPASHVKAAIVMHTTAAKDALGNAGYKARYGVDNPNLPLLEALARAGVRIYVCGQSASSRGLKWDEIAPVAKVALSAMTAHALLAAEGYTTNPF